MHNVVLVDLSSCTCVVVYGPFSTLLFDQSRQFSLAVNVRANKLQTDDDRQSGATQHLTTNRQILIDISSRRYLRASTTRNCQH